jgi:predicted tellurium resistance membrane protein TerC
VTGLWTIENAIAFLTLTGLEIVLGIDNIVFIAVITNRLDASVQARARRIGIFLAMFTRIALLFSLSLILGLTEPWFTLFSQEVSGRNLVLLLGGLFLIGKATFEVHERIEGGTHGWPGKTAVGFASAVIQITILDIVFSLDSVITAVGMVDHVAVMVVAIVAAVVVMLAFSGPVSGFVNRHPTIQMLAFSFLILVGIFLVAEGLGRHIDRGYIYFAMAFSLAVEFLNLKMRRKI